MLNMVAFLMLLLNVKIYTIFILFYSVLIHFLFNSGLISINV